MLYQNFDNGSDMRDLVRLPSQTLPYLSLSPSYRLFLSLSNLGFSSFLSLQSTCVNSWSNYRDAPLIHQWQVAISQRLTRWHSILFICSQHFIDTYRLHSLFFPSHFLVVDKKVILWVFQLESRDDIHLFLLLYIKKFLE